MAVNRDINIRLKLEDKATRGLSRATKGLGKFQKAAGLAAGLLGVLGLTLGIRGLIRGLSDSVEKFGVQERAVARLAGSLTNVAGVTEEHVRQLLKQASALQDVTTFGDETIISAQAMLGTFQLNKEAIEKLTPRILDMTAALEKSSGGQQDVEAVTIAVGKAMTLGVGALTRYGVVISDAAKKAFDLADEQEKVNIITEELDKNFKGIAEASGKTLSGRLIRLRNQFGDLKESVGGFVSIALVGLVEAILGADKGLTTFGDNAVTVGRAIGLAMVSAAQVTMVAWQNVSAAIGVAKIAFEGLEVAGLKASKKVAEAIEKDPTGALKFLSLETRSVGEINNLLGENADKVNAIIDEQANLNSKTQDFINQTEKLRDELRAVNDITEITIPNLGSLGKATKAVAEAEEDAGKEAKKQEDKTESLLQKIKDLKRTQVETTQVIKDTMRDQKDALADLSAEYDKTIANIQARLGELDTNFGRSEGKRKESFLLSIASQAKQAERNIKDREELIEEELAKGMDADKKKVKELESANDKARGIISSNEKLIADGKEERARREGARGIEFLIQQFEEEGRLAREKFEKDKAELQTQLDEKEQQFKESNEAILMNTQDTLDKIKDSYIDTFDKLYNELKENKAVRLLQQIGLISLDPSQQAKASLDKLLGKIPQFADGGVVPGPRNQPTLGILHGGETVIPNKPTNINFGGVTINNNADTGVFMRELQRVLGGQTESTKLGVL